MNKTELTAAVAEKAGLSKVDAAKAVSAFCDTIEAALAKGESVQIIGFGTFEVGTYAARTGRNPPDGRNARNPGRQASEVHAGHRAQEGRERLIGVMRKGESSRSLLSKPKKKRLRALFVFLMSFSAPVDVVAFENVLRRKNGALGDTANAPHVARYPDEVVDRRIRVFKDELRFAFETIVIDAADKSRCSHIFKIIVDVGLEKADLLEDLREEIRVIGLQFDFSELLLGDLYRFEHAGLFKTFAAPGNGKRSEKNPPRRAQFVAHEAEHRIAFVQKRQGQNKLLLHGKVLNSLPEFVRLKNEDLGIAFFHGGRPKNDSILK